MTTKTGKISILVVVFFLMPALFGSAAAQDFTIGVYHHWGTGENYSWEYGLMELARNGCDIIVASSSYSRGAQFWAASKHWGIKGIGSYAVLNSGTPPDYVVDEAALTTWILSNKDYWDNLFWNGEHVGDNVIGRIVCDEPECGDGLTEQEKNYIRAYCDLSLALDPARETWVNHCGSPWYDLHEVHVSSSIWNAISVNSGRLDEMITESQNMGLPGYTAVQFTRRFAEQLSDCLGVNTAGFGPPCLPETFEWLDSRTNYEDIYEQMVTAFLRGASGMKFYRFNDFDPNLGDGNYALLDGNGVDFNYRMAAFGDAARAIRDSQGWPSVSLARKVSPRNMPPLMDRRNYPSGNITLVAKASQGSAPVQKVIFGKTTNGGATWETVEDTSYPYETTFSLSAGTTVILRAQAIDTTGQGSIWAANMLYIVDPSALECGDYESALLPGDINKDCRVDMADIAELIVLWLRCDFPDNPHCDTTLPESWFCGQPGSGLPALSADVDDDCDIDLADFSIVAGSLLDCDDPVTTNCP
ncbi:MAG: hypothetical protein ABIG61_16540 [Planctomycetota bacterium]